MNGMQEQGGTFFMQSDQLKNEHFNSESSSLQGEENKYSFENTANFNIDPLQVDNKHYDMINYSYNGNNPSTQSDPLSGGTGTYSLQNENSQNTFSTEFFKKISKSHFQDIKKGKIKDTDSDVEKLSKIGKVKTLTGKKFQCKLCQFETNNKRTLSNHAFRHSEPKRKQVVTRMYSCPQCEHVTNRKSSLIEHIRVHTGEKPFECKYCDYKTSRRCHLVIHTRIHTGERPYPCPMCPLRFSSSTNLHKHVKKHTGERPFACSLCDYRSKEKNSLVKHIRGHTGEMPYICNYCEYKTVHKANLINHVRLHTGEKPYACDQCSYKSAERGNLKKHMIKHTERPFLCNICQHRFREKSAFLNHMKSTHKNCTFEVPIMKPNDEVPKLANDITSDLDILAPDVIITVKIEPDDINDEMPEYSYDSD